ncbi:MAG: ATP-binding protein, partial [Alphaproteobacteria bacterium]|nr:ATP-binding protein [Alphaproteobacteria bacterium]
DHIEIAVADQGPGIPKDELGNLFSKFEKLSVQPTAGEHSTGLGLSIVKNIIEAHDGSIDVESEIGVGTVLSISLPLRPGS